MLKIMREFKRTMYGKSFIVLAEPDLSAQVDTLLRALFDVGVDALTDGYALRLGWTVYFVEYLADGHYQITTPDYSKNPLVDRTNDLTLSLYVQLEQSSFLRRVGLDGQVVRFEDKVILSKGVLDCPDVYLQRSGGVDTNDSGWYIGLVNGSDESELYALYVYQLLKLRHELLKVMSLPDDYMVLFSGSDIVSVVDPADNELALNS